MISRPFAEAMNFPDELIVSDCLHKAGAALEAALKTARKNPRSSWKYLPRIRELIGLIHRLETLALAQEIVRDDLNDLRELDLVVEGMFRIE